jgi:hypothetical protein
MLIEETFSHIWGWKYLNEILVEPAKSREE